MHFAKYQGTGNDFVMLSDVDDEIKLTSELVRRLCDRRFGIGADGVIRIAPPSSGGDLFMDYVNSDGSVGEMCGNGIRCLAVFARHAGLIAGDRVAVETRAGLKAVTMSDAGVTVDMGPPIFHPAAIPVLWEGPDALHAKIELPNEMMELACLSMGNPHAVAFVEDPSSAPLRDLGPVIEHHDAFPNGTNVEFVRVLTPSHIEMRVWERGSGETLACGTGAAAAAVAARLLRDTDPSVTVSLPGGDLTVEWRGSLGETSSVFLSGPAEKVFEGQIDLPTGDAN
jgi:diaminopimelate epimerase